MRRLSQSCNATQGLGDQCQETSVLKAMVAATCQETSVLKALVASLSQGTDALKVDYHTNWTRAETRVSRLEAEVEASRDARLEASAMGAQMLSRQVELEARVARLETEVGRLAKETAQPPRQPIIAREDGDGLAAHILGKLQAQIADEVGACATWYRENHDEPWKQSTQAQLMDLLRLGSQTEPEAPVTSPLNPPQRSAETRPPPPPLDSSSTDADPEPPMRRERLVRREVGAVPVRGPEAAPGRSAAYLRLDALYAKSQEALKAKAACLPRVPTIGSEESESSGTRVPTTSSARTGRSGVSKTTESQRAAVRRLRARGVDLKPPGYESEDSPPRQCPHGRVEWGRS